MTPPPATPDDPASTTARLVRQLRRALADAGAADVQCIETHISWLLLAGERAYKFKKPLVLDFLDFGTLARPGHLRHRVAAPAISADSE